MTNEASTLKRIAARAALLAGLSVLVCACGLGRDNLPATGGSGGAGGGNGQAGTGGGAPDPGGPDSPGGGGGDGGGGIAITWGPRLPGSGLSAVGGAEDGFGAGVAEALERAARTLPIGASQSSKADKDGRTSDEMSVEVVRDDDGNLVYDVTDRSTYLARVPLPVPRQDSSLALFTDLIPGIEPDLSSFPHEVLGVWAWNGEAGAFWSATRPIPPVEFGPASPAGSAVYEGDAVGLRAAGGAVTKFLADARLTANFDSHTIGGGVTGFRALDGTAIGGLSVTLRETRFADDGAPFEGATEAAGIEGGGEWGARWSDGKGRSMGGTFGFAAGDGSVTLLGAFSAGCCASAAPGNPDDPVASR